MKNICLYFQLHQSVKLRRYRFFDIGNDHYYYDDYANESNINRLAHLSYLPTNKILLELIKKYKGKFSVTFSITGTLLDQLKIYAPEVIDSFKALAKTKHVEFLAETSAHSLASLRNTDEFKRQIAEQVKNIEETFGVVPTVFRNTELIYSDYIGEVVSQLGFKAILAEGAKQILGWKSPNYLYCNAVEPRLKVLLKNYGLSDDIALRFGNQSWSEWPLTAQKYKSWIDGLPAQDEIVNLFLNYETFGANHSAESGIFDFLRALPETFLSDSNYVFTTPSKAANELQPVSAIHVPTPTSWVDEERDVTAWLGNELQNEAADKLYALSELVAKCDDPTILKDWQYLQSSDHLYYMSTKFFSNGVYRAYASPYQTPYDAFMNFMNVLTDFSDRLHKAVQLESTETASLKATIKKQTETINSLEEQLVKVGVRPISGTSKPKKIATNSTKKTTATKTTKNVIETTIPAKKVIVKAAKTDDTASSTKKKAAKAEKKATNSK